MKIPFSIIAGAALIALAILFAFHWQMDAFGSNVYRMNKWTGEIHSCSAALSQAVIGNEYRCNDLTPAEIEKLISGEAAKKSPPPPPGFTLDTPNGPNDQ